MRYKDGGFRAEGGDFTANGLVSRVWCQGLSVEGIPCKPLRVSLLFRVWCKGLSVEGMPCKPLRVSL